MATDAQYDVPKVYRFKDLEVEDMERGLIQIGDMQDLIMLNADEAIALRDWLNKRFPK